jgi:mannose/cellobiose epimerase-like protein (N-acyl-D-glucosamine 2-epimerase family)
MRNHPTPCSPAALVLVLVGAIGMAGCGENPSPLLIVEEDSYQPTSELLVEPDLAVDLVAELADFWVAARDDEAGGFFSFVEQDGSVGGQRDKSLVVQSRDAYGFVRAFMLTGDEAYLDHADHALAFLTTHGWDETHGGWYFATDEQGELTGLFGEDWDPNTFKWSFVQHYALVGPAAMCEVTRDEEACGWLDAGIGVLDEHLWDPDPQRFGYHDEAQLDWSQPAGKGFTPTVDAFTTHARTAFLIAGDMDLETRLLELADNMSDHLVGAAGLNAVELGFPETFDSDWDIDYSATASQPGHVLKTAWCLADAHALDPGAGYDQDARELVRDMLDNGGYDGAHGGPLYEVDWTTGAVTSDDKVYWVLEQGVTAGLSAYQLADDPGDRDDFLRMADESLDFYLTHLVDPDHGETWSTVSRDGAEVLEDAKGDAFKGAYHSIELGYYTYLYGKLWVAEEPITLFYRFEASDAPREFFLDPLPVAPGTLSITEVTLDDEPFASFDGEGRSLQLAAGVGGVFRVTFGTL